MVSAIGASMRLFLSLFILSSSAWGHCPKSLADLFPLPKPTAKITAILNAKISPETTYISKTDALKIQKELNLTENQFMIELLPVAQRLATPSISNYHVGAVGKTKTGSYLLGANIEFVGGDPNGTIHGEHFLIASALLSGASGFDKIAVSAAPCGLCRQMINETAGSAEIEILIPRSYPIKFTKVLPGSFGPKDLGLKGALLNSSVRSYKIKATKDPLVLQAARALEHSYSPYIRMATGIALELKDGRVVQGFHFENAAFQKVSALNVALVALYSRGIRDFSLIKRAVLIQEFSKKSQGSEIDDTRSILSKIAPDAELEVHDAYDPIEIPQ